MLSTADFTWKKGNGSSDLARLGLREFPKTFEVRSHKTGAVMRFEVDSFTMMENEFFDGEATAYCAVGWKNIKVQIWC